MHKFKRLFSRAEFHIFFGYLCLVVFSWPFVSMSGRHAADAVFLYLFLPWAIVILLLFLISRSYDISSSHEQQQEREET